MLPVFVKICFLEDMGRGKKPVFASNVSTFTRFFSPSVLAWI
jgi:hypothetical protein